MNGALQDFPSLKPGGHVCLPYATEKEKHEAIAAFIRDGLRRGERCAYWGSPANFAAIVGHLGAARDALAARKTLPALVFSDSASPNLPAVTFDPSTQAATVHDAIAVARSAGFAGFRLAGDPDASMRAAVRQDQLAAYETALTHVLTEDHASALCVFDQRTTDTASMEVALSTHDLTIVAGRLCQNPFSQPAAHAGAPAGGPERIAWMMMNILETEENREFLDAENAALIMEGARLGQRDVEYRRQIAGLTRAIEARDRLLITTARWLARPLPMMCNHLDSLSRDAELVGFHDTFEVCSEHLGAISRLSRGLDEIAGFLQMQVVLRPESLDIVTVAKNAIAAIGEDPALAEVAIVLENADRIAGTWDRLRLDRLFHFLIRTARDQGYDTGVHLRLDDLGKIVRIQLEFQLPGGQLALSESGERSRALLSGPSDESDYERLAVSLWPSRELVRIMGGTIGVSTWADSRVIFTIDLPKTHP